MTAKPISEKEIEKSYYEHEIIQGVKWQFRQFRIRNDPPRFIDLLGRDENGTRVIGEVKKVPLTS